MGKGLIEFLDTDIVVKLSALNLKLFENVYYYRRIVTCVHTN